MFAGINLLTIYVFEYIQQQSFEQQLTKHGQTHLAS